MAHVVGVPKRDPCRKCQLPVFLAERLTVGKNVYHRSCLKCARCGYQLTPGNFYETETDEQYCCETCPDEEVINKSNADSISLGSGIGARMGDLRETAKSETNISETQVGTVRSSIKERLAFFENQKCNLESDPKLLLKSLSDEEKSKSLKKAENLTGIVDVSYKINPALSNFLNNSNDSDEGTSDDSSIPNSKMDFNDSENDADVVIREAQIPELSKRRQFSVSTQLVLGTSINISSLDNSYKKENAISNSTKQSQSFDNPNNNISGETTAPALQIDRTATEQTKEETVEIHKKVENAHLEIREIVEINDNYCITKDKQAADLIANTTGEGLQHLLDVRETTNNKDKALFDQNLIQLRTIINNEIIKNPQLEKDKTFETQTLQSSDLLEIDSIVSKEDEMTKPESHEDNVIIGEDRATDLINCHDVIVEGDEKSENSLNNIKPALENPNINFIGEKVPLEMKTKDKEKLDCNLSNKEEHLEEENLKKTATEIQTLHKRKSRAIFEEYPQDLNPFKSDEEIEDERQIKKENVALKKTLIKSTKLENLNPFDSSDDEIELEKAQQSSYNKTPKVPPPRPPPPRISKNPFGSEEEDEDSHQHSTRCTSLSGLQNRKTPVPIPRSNISQSHTPTPEPTPRVSTKVKTPTLHSASTTPYTSSLPILQNSSEYYGSANSLYSNNTTPNSLLRNSDLRSSNNSLNISSGGTIRSRKSRRAPLPPAPVKELFPSNETINGSSKTSTPSSSTVGTPKSSRKRRPAPAPPKPARLDASKVPELHVDTVGTEPKNLNNYPLQSELDSKLSDEEKALLEGNALQPSQSVASDLFLLSSSKHSSKRLITLDKELLEEHGSMQSASENSSQCDDLKQQNQQNTFTTDEGEANVVYRRVLIPSNLETPTREHNLIRNDLCKPHSPVIGRRQIEKLKDNKEINNRNRQSQISVSSSVADDIDPLFNKSAHGKWKRRKGPAPGLPLPPRKVLQMLPLQEIKHELEIIEVQQQGLEKQGVILEKMIRDRCEGENGIPAESKEFPSASSTENSKEVENLILQLFELVNEKNELFRRQAELMYLRRQHRLEQEQADLEYEIRILMAQPERNKTDSDKAREEALIERLLEVVQLRNEVVECLEMDRIREAEEDQSIKQRLESHIAKRDNDYVVKKTLINKLSKKEKKKQKEAKNLFKNKKHDADKDADESESNVEKQKSKKKKKLLIF